MPHAYVLVGTYAFLKRGRSSTGCKKGAVSVCEIYRYGSQSVIRIITDQNQKWSASQKKGYYHFAAPIRSDILVWVNRFSLALFDVVPGPLDLR